jgi:transcriptional regulator of heat shock response
MITKRQEKILDKVIAEYTKTAEPVGSLALLKKYDFGISAATARVELSSLEKEGFLYQPHTSSGRVPTDKGYRFYVSKLMKNRSLSLSDQKRLQEEHLKLMAKNARLTRMAAKLLSAFSRNLAISGLIEDEEYFQSGVKELLRHPEFNKIDEVCKTIEVLDYLDENVEKLISKIKRDEVKTLIGRENPLMESEGCSLVVSRTKLKNGKNVIIALMGPKRMEYARNISLVKHMKNLLGSGELDNISGKSFKD